MSAPATDAPENRLARETSPYLLQHKTNPVEWWPWGSEALAEAQRANKPILLSIGYAACHWCHVMAHESFEDPGVAALMNELFVNIKVDREERPDIDQIYMSALHLMGDQGGWPLTMFLTPDGKPFWGGTYFPKTSRYGRPGFTDVLREIARLWRDEPTRIKDSHDSLMSRLVQAARPQGKVVIGIRELDHIARQLRGNIDPVNGGLGGAPKFPQAALFELLWRAGLRTGDDAYFDAVELTLERICQGGIYDHLGGGFARYSVDERWLVPHFEKMLYDNAQLLELLALGYAHSHKPLYHQRARETVAWLAREMTTTEGAFSASLDADSEGEEGRFYVWSLAEIIKILGPDDADLLGRHYGVTSEGNFEGRNILNRLHRMPPVAGDEERLAVLRGKLLDEREKRVRPGLDDKVLADWNGLMIAALVQAGVTFAEPDWIGMASRAFDVVATNMTRGDRLGHSWRQGRLLFPGLASDFAGMIKAAIVLAEATGDPDHLDRAIAWQAMLERHYANPANGGYYLTADDAEGLVMRPSSTHDDATPNPNAIIAQNLHRLAVLTGDDEYRKRLDHLFDGLLPLAAESLLAHTALLNALDLRLRGAEIVVTGNNLPLTVAALQLPYITRVVLRATAPDTLPPDHPAQDKLRTTTEAAAFICVGQTCSLPVTRPEEVAETVRKMRG